MISVNLDNLEYTMHKTSVETRYLRVKPTHVRETFPRICLLKYKGSRLNKQYSNCLQPLTQFDNLISMKFFKKLSNFDGKLKNG